MKLPDIKSHSPTTGARRGLEGFEILLLLPLQKNSLSSYQELLGIVSLVAYAMELTEELARFSIWTIFSVLIVMPMLKL